MQPTISHEQILTGFLGLFCTKEDASKLTDQLTQLQSNLSSLRTDFSQFNSVVSDVQSILGTVNAINASLVQSQDRARALESELNQLKEELEQTGERAVRARQERDELAAKLAEFQELLPAYELYRWLLQSPSRYDFIKTSLLGSSQPSFHGFLARATRQDHLKNNWDDLALRTKRERAGGDREAAELMAFCVTSYNQAQGELMATIVKASQGDTFDDDAHQRLDPAAYGRVVEELLLPGISFTRDSGASKKAVVKTT